MDKQIPLLDDISKTYSDVDVTNIVEVKMLEIHKNLTENINSNFSNEDIYNYIKFINFTCMDKIHYKHVSKYINKDNIKYFTSLFKNEDITLELIPHLEYKTVSKYLNFETPGYLQEIWIYSNIMWVIKYYTKFLNLYIIYNSKYGEYYSINNEVYGAHKKINWRKFDSNHIIHDLTYVSEQGFFKVVKYIIDMTNLEKIVEDKDKDLFVYICSESICKASKNGYLEIVMFLTETLKKNNMLKLTEKTFELGRYKSFFWGRFAGDNEKILKYFIEEVDINPCFSLLNMMKFSNDVEPMNKFIQKICTDSRDTYNFKLTNFIYWICNGGYTDGFKYIMNCGVHIDIVEHGYNILDVASENYHWDIVKYAIECGVSIDKCWSKIIDRAIYDENKDMIEYILEKLKDLENVDSDILVKLAAGSGNTEIINLIIDDKIYLNKIKNIKGVLSAAFRGGCIDFIKRIIHRGYHISIMDMILLLNKSEEGEYIDFIKYMCNNEIYINDIEVIASYAVEKCYYDLTVFICDKKYSSTIARICEKLNPFNFENVYEISLKYIGTCIKYSENEDECSKIIKYLHGKKMIKIHDIEEIVYLATLKGYLELVKYFESHIKNVNVVLIRACLAGHLEIIKYAVSLNADLNYMHREEHDIVFKHNYSKRHGIIEYIMLNTSEFHGQYKDKNNYDEIITHLVTTGLNKNKAMKYVHIYREEINTNTYVKLIKRLYDDNTEKNIIKNIIIKSCVENDLELIKFFLELGIYYHINEMLEISSKYNNVDIVKFIVDNSEYSKHIKKYSNKSIINAAENDNLNIIKILVNYVSVNNCRGLALMKSCIYNYLETIEYFLENDVDIRICNYKALNICARRGSIEIVKLFIEKGAPLNLLRKYSNIVEVHDYLVDINRCDLIKDNDYDGSDSDSYSSDFDSDSNFDYSDIYDENHYGSDDSYMSDDEN